MNNSKAKTFSYLARYYECLLDQVLLKSAFTFTVSEHGVWSTCPTCALVLHSPNPATQPLGVTTCFCESNQGNEDLLRTSLAIHLSRDAWKGLFLAVHIWQAHTSTICAHHAQLTQMTKIKWFEMLLFGGVNPCKTDDLSQNSDWPKYTNMYHIL